MKHENTVYFIIIIIINVIIHQEFSKTSVVFREDLPKKQLILSTNHTWTITLGECIPPKHTDSGSGLVFNVKLVNDGLVVLGIDNLMVFNMTNTFGTLYVIGPLSAEAKSAREKLLHRAGDGYIHKISLIILVSRIRVL